MVRSKPLGKRSPTSGRFAQSPFVTPPKPKSKLRCIPGLSIDECRQWAVANASYEDTPKSLIADNEFRLARSTPTLKIYKHKDDLKNHFIAGVRGTASLEDVLTDVNLIVGRLTKTERYKRDRDALRTFLEEHPEATVRLTGHSLGGAIARELKREFGDRVQAGVTFNSAFDVTQLGEGAHGGFQNIYSQNDPLGKLANASKGHVRRYYKTDHLLPISAHKLGTFVEDAGN